MKNERTEIAKLAVVCSDFAKMVILFVRHSTGWQSYIAIS